MKIFIDTGAFLALQIKNDHNHLTAKRHFDLSIKKRAQFFTSDYVLAEVYTRLIYDVHLKAARSFHKHIKLLIEKNQLNLLETDPAGLEKVWDELMRHFDHKLSFTDAAIIVQFKRHHLDEIFTFDKQFRNINLPTNLA